MRPDVGISVLSGYVHGDKMTMVVAAWSGALYTDAGGSSNDTGCNCRTGPVWADDGTD